MPTANGNRLVRHTALFQLCSTGSPVGMTDRDGILFDLGKRPVPIEGMAEKIVAEAIVEHRAKPTVDAGAMSAPVGTCSPDVHSRWHPTTRD